ncbi:MAG: MBL fold metallo-hydrolase [Chitinophagaceae bacterium]
MPTHFITADLVKIYTGTESRSDLITVAAWGDPVEVVKVNAASIEVSINSTSEAADGSVTSTRKSGFIHTKGKNTKEFIRPFDERDVLSVAFVDVQQGDGCVIETPEGKVMLIDGGENQLFARYLASRFPGTSLTNPKEIECIVVTHGDADHYAGLPEIEKSERHSESKKRLFIKPLRVFHNGIIKRPGKDADKKDVPDLKLLGKTKKVGDDHFLTELEDDLLTVPDKNLNKYFKEWKHCLQAYTDFHGGIEQKRLDSTMKNQFEFLDEGITVDVLGPITEEIDDKVTLKFLREPRSRAAIPTATPRINNSFSASHTINGHSIILKLTYGNVRFLFSGDLNEEAEEILVEASSINPDVLRAEVLKVPHHGSGDFSNDFLEAVSPVVSVVSSGDETEQKEYIHPRATLMGALGKHSRINRPLVFVTELVAFFKMEGFSKSNKTPSKSYFGFSRSAFGIVHVRTDGKRMLVFTHSGKKNAKEAYAYTIESLNVMPVSDEVKIF